MVLLAAFFGALAISAPGAVSPGPKPSTQVEDCLRTIRSLCLRPAILSADEGKELEACFQKLKKLNPTAEDLREAAVFLMYKSARDYWQLRSFFLDLSKLPLAPKLDRVLKLDRGQLDRTYKMLMKVGQGLVTAQPLADHLPGEFTPEESWEAIDGHLPLLAPGHSQPNLPDLWASFQTLLKEPMAQSEGKYQKFLAKIQAAWQKPETLAAQPEEVVQFVKVYGRLRMYYRRFAGLSKPR